jgi:hypothetical protein
MVVLDEWLVGVLDSVAWAFEHVIVVSHSGSVPPGTAIDYESLIASARPISCPPVGEPGAAVMCHSSRTKGRPNGLVYSHRALF